MSRVEAVLPSEAVATPDRMATTLQNAEAGRFLATARHELRLSQSQFVKRLTTELGLPVSQSALSGWETGGRSVPAATIVVALGLLGLRLTVGDSSVEGVPGDRLYRVEESLKLIGSRVATALDLLAEAGEAPEAARELAREIRAGLDAAE